MAVSKAIEVLQKFSEEEIIRFGEFLEKGIANTTESHFSFYKALLPHIHAAELPKEEIWTRFHAELPFDDRYFRKLLSELLARVKIFLRQENAHLEEFGVELNYLKFLGLHHLDELHLKEAKLLRQRRAEQMKHPDPVFYLQEFGLEDYLYRYAINQQNRTPDSRFDEMEAALDHYYLIQKLRVLIEKTHFYLVYQASQSTEGEPPLLAKIRESGFQDSVLIWMYLGIYHMTQKPAGQIKGDFLEWKNAFARDLAKFPLGFQEEIQNLRVSLCVRGINANVEADFFVAEMQEIFMDRIQSGSIFSDGAISAWDYINAISATLKLGKLDQAQKLIESLSTRLPAADYESTYHLCRALWMFQAQKYDKIQAELNKVDDSNGFYGLVSRSILIKTYWELKDYETLFSKVESSLKFVERNKEFSRAKKDRFKNRLKLLQKIVREETKSQRSEKELQKLEEEVKASKNNPDQEFLLRKLREMRMGR
ncbi:MAG: hypothetical protein H6581_25365 [Bacteroidia bacterium]|nr:hypothetical protein [Bacteroidia bacterium]